MICKPIVLRGQEDWEKVQPLGTWELSTDMDSGSKTIVIHLGTKNSARARALVKLVVKAIEKGWKV